MDYMYRGMDLTDELFITNKDNTRIPFVIDEFEYDSGFIYPHIEGHIVGSAYYNPSFTKIKDVIFNDPATIVLWIDGSKTVVKCQEGDEYDKTKGLALCIAKKYFGNKGNYNEIFKKWIPDEDLSEFSIFDDATHNVKKNLEDLGKKLSNLFNK